MSTPGPATPLHVTLTDGTAVLLRPVTPEDRHHIIEGMNRLSAESKLTRFFTAAPRLTERQLSYLTEVDQRGHVAWGALTVDDQMIGLGVGRFVRLASDPGTAEVAITVVDEYQGRGLGTILLALLFRLAHQGGVTRFRAHVLAQNGRLVRALCSLGGRVLGHEDGAVEIDVPVVHTPSELPDSPVAMHLREAFERIQAALRRDAG